jgi:hypothetical protein
VPKNDPAKGRYYAAEIGDTVVSFTAPEDEAIKIANHFQAWYNRRHNSHEAFQLRKITGGEVRRLEKNATHYVLAEMLGLKR